MIPKSIFYACHRSGGKRKTDLGKFYYPLYYPLRNRTQSKNRGSFIILPIRFGSFISR